MAVWWEKRADQSDVGEGDRDQTRRFRVARKRQRLRTFSSELGPSPSRDLLMRLKGRERRMGLETTFPSLSLVSGTFYLPTPGTDYSTAAPSAGRRNERTAD